MTSKLRSRAPARNQPLNFDPEPQRKPSKQSDDTSAPVDLERIQRECARICSPEEPAMLQHILWVNWRLQQLGSASFSDWTKWMIGEFYRKNQAHPQCTDLVCCMGRGGGKSTLSTHFGIAETLLPIERQKIPIGEQWQFLYLSLPRDADRRLRHIEKVTTSLFGDIIDKKNMGSGRLAVETKDLLGNAIIISVVPLRVQAVSGQTMVGWVLDEVAKYLEAGRTVNPPEEVAGSLSSAARARPIRRMLISSPWTDSGYFDAQTKRTDDGAYVANLGPFVEDARKGFLDVALWEEQHDHKDDAERLRKLAADLNEETRAIPTWLGNPSVPPVPSREEVEKQTMLPGVSKLDYWLREYAAIPMQVGGGCDAEGYVELTRRLTELPRSVRMMDGEYVATSAEASRVGVVDGISFGGGSPKKGEM